jgi:hypothetical protein
MWLADTSFKITLATRSFILRPTLRAAFDLNRDYSGFHKLYDAILDGSYSACADLISATCTDPRSWIAYACVPSSNAVREVLEARDQLIRVVLALTGDDADGRKAQSPGKPMPFDEYHEHLFKIGGGWLGWTPEATWNATPAEILAAFAGRQDMLKVLFGKREDEETVDLSSADARAQLNALGDMSVKAVSRTR